MYAPWQAPHMNRHAYGRICIKWIRAYYDCLIEHRPVELLPYVRQLRLF